MKKCILFVFFAVAFFGADAQTRLIGERSVYTQYFLSPYLLNPGAAGQNEYSQVLANYRNTWASFPGSPTTVTVSYDGPIGNRVGLSIYGLTDSFAALRTSKGGVNLSYTIESPTNKVGVGISTEFIQHKLSSDELVGQLVNTSDPEILNRLDGTSYFDVAFGAYGIYDGKLMYGLTFPSIVSQRVSGIEGTQAETELFLSDIITDTFCGRFHQKVKLLPTNSIFSSAGDVSWQVSQPWV